MVNTMKASAGASFSPAQISASYSQGSQTASDKSKQTSSLNSSLSWQAQGGTTLHCNKSVFILIDRELGGIINADLAFTSLGHQPGAPQLLRSTTGE